MTKIFDLNIEDVLENWEPYHAIREVIANALDEQLISETADIEISEGEDGWHIRDFGRGIQIEHFTMNENPEKLDSKDGVIGKFGATDATRRFESELTQYLGSCADEAIGDRG